MTIPDQLSIDPAYPGYRADWHAVSRGLIITLDGLKQAGVIAYDRCAGRLVRYEEDCEGRVVVRDDAASIEIVEGAISVTRQHQ